MSLLREPGTTRPDTSPARSSGLFDTIAIRVANRWRDCTNERNDMANNNSKVRAHLAACGNDMNAYDNGDKWRDAGYTGPLNDAGDPAQQDDTDPRAWEALKTKFQNPADYR
jgi:hypothetical protein